VALAAEREGLSWEDEEVAIEAEIASERGA